MGSLPIKLVIEMGLLIYPLQKAIREKGMRKLRDATLMIFVVKFAAKYIFTRSDSSSTPSQTPSVITLITRAMIGPRHG